jgi:hypothetical protein
MRFSPSATIVLVLLAAAHPLYTANAAARPTLQAASPSTENDASDTYTLTMDNLTRTFKAGSELSTLTSKDPDFKATYDKAMNASTLREGIGLMEASPAFSGVLKSENISARDFLLTITCYVEVMSLADMLKSGGDSSAFVASQKFNHANLDFYLKNEAAIKALDQKYSDAGSPQ